ncbi:MAG: S8 family serine peptidase [Armatimonadetes bacterium]|nr:S8 family serine peptidase [Armatimonadota bacterium]
MNTRDISTKLGWLALAASLAVSATAQSVTNKAELLKLAQLYKAQSQVDALTAQAYSVKTGSPVTKLLPGGGVRTLVRAPNGIPVWLQTDNLDAARDVGSAALWPGSGKSSYALTGSRAKIAIWDGGVADVTRDEFSGRLTNGDGSGVGDHAYHVAGTVFALGLNPQAHGMSFGASGRVFDSNGDLSEMASEAAGNLMLSNHSYSFRSGWLANVQGDGKWGWLGDTAVSKDEDYKQGQYDTKAAQVDTMLYNAPFYLPCTSAGNTHGNAPATQPVDHWVLDANGAWIASSDVHYDQSAYDQLSHGTGTAKNSLTVAATEKLSGAGYTGPSSVRIASFSSWGPADSGRIKPEIAAPGVDLVSTVPGGYAAFSGTSMSTPCTTGSLGLLQDLYIQKHGGPMRASMLKGLVMHTAKEAGANPGPDYIFGFGLLDVLAGADAISDGLFNPVQLTNLTIRTGVPQTINISANSGKPLKVTICWTDPAGVVQGAVLDDPTSRLVSDLDLRVTDSSGTTTLPWVLDANNPGNGATRGDNTVDPEEQVVVQNPVSGSYSITISNKGALPPSGQVVSIIISGDLPTGISGLDLAPSSVVGGVQNSVGTIRLADVQATPTTVTLTSSDTTAATVPPTISIPAGSTSGNFNIKTFNVRPGAGNAYVPVSINAVSAIGGSGSTLQVHPVGILAVNVNPSSIVGGTSVPASVTLNSPAPSGGIAVSLTTSSQNSARPSRNWIYIPSGRSVGAFTLRTYGVNENTPVTISADRLGTSLSTDITVLRASLLDFAATPSALSQGAVKLVVTLDGVAGPAGVTVLLQSSNPGVLSVPAVVKILSGKKSAVVIGTATRQSVRTSVDVTATRSGSSKVATVTVG